METPLGTIATAVITPFAKDGTLDLDTFRSLLHFLVENGSDGIVVCGTTGESPTLSDTERVALWQTAVAEVGGAATIIAGSTTNDTRHSIELTQQARSVGVDAILAVAPYYNRPPAEGLIRHFRAIARAAGSLPVALYNVPSRTAIDLTPHIIAQLAEIDNIVALKQANPDLAAASEITALAPNLALYAGNDTSLIEMLPLGAVGGVLVSSHLVGAQMREIVEAWHDGDHERATQIDASIRDVYETMAITTNPIPVKTAMGMLGFAVGDLRLPMVAASAMQRERIRSMLARHELLGLAPALA